MLGTGFVHFQGCFGNQVGTSPYTVHTLKRDTSFLSWLKFLLFSTWCFRSWWLYSLYIVGVYVITEILPFSLCFCSLFFICCRIFGCQLSAETRIYRLLLTVDVNFFK